MKKNMSVSDGATILQLLNSAATSGINRRVSFNNRPKTKSDIVRYIAKSARVQSETSLLKYLPPTTDWSPQITWQDTPGASFLELKSFGASEPLKTASQSASSYVMIPGETTSDPPPGSIRSYSMISESMDKVSAPHSVDESSREDTLQNTSGQSSAPIHHTGHQDEIMWEDYDFVLPNDTFGSFDELVGPMAYATLSQPPLDPNANAKLDQLNRYMSSTPEALDHEVQLGPKEAAHILDLKVEEMLGKGDSHPQFRCREKSHHFLRFCCMASIYEGQRQDDSLKILAAEEHYGL